MISFEVLAEFIEEPKHAARLVAERKPWPLGLAAFLVAGGSLFLSQAVSRHFLPVASGPASFVAVCLWTLVSGFLLVAALHLLADAQGLEGSGVALFVLVGMSELVWALVLPASLVLRALRADSFLTLLPLLALAGILSLRLKARSIRHVYGVSATKAWGLLMLPYMGSFLIVAAIGAAALVSAAVSIVKLFH
ncbi:MAG: hypothetical protein HY553_12545 [Elusimicrobia bacterium]|nr:hypothetical protein [Elusimicrobiota bacterium]